MCLAVGGILSAVGGMVSAMGQASALNAQAQYHDQQARLEKKKRIFLEARQRRQTSRIEGSQRAAAAGSGATQDSFSPQIEDSYEQALLDEGLVWFNGKKAEGDEKAKAAIKRSEASNAAFSGVIGAISPVLKGFG